MLLDLITPDTLLAATGIAVSALAVGIHCVFTCITTKKKGSFKPARDKRRSHNPSFPSKSIPSDSLSMSRSGEMDVDSAVSRASTAAPSQKKSLSAPPSQKRAVFQSLRNLDDESSLSRSLKGPGPLSESSDYEE